MGDLIQLQARSCFFCTHARYGGPLTWCQQFMESIANEREAAADCAAYEPEEEF